MKKFLVILMVVLIVAILSAPKEGDVVATDDGLYQIRNGKAIPVEKWEEIE